MTTNPSTEHVSSRARQAIDGLAGTARDLGHEAASLLDRAGSKVGELPKRSLDAVIQGSHQVQDRTRIASIRVSRRIRDEPLKSVLIAMVAGGLLVALAGLGRHLRAQR